MPLNNYLPSYIGLILILLMILFGQAFRKNWKNKNNRWLLKAWVYGLISFFSFILPNTHLLVYIYKGFNGERYRLVSYFCRMQTY